MKKLSLLLSVVLFSSAALFAGDDKKEKKETCKKESSCCANKKTAKEGEKTAETASVQKTQTLKTDHKLKELPNNELHPVKSAVSTKQ